MATQETKTPLMDQYFAIKATYPETLLLMRVGDFYETYGEDAVKSSKALGIVLTHRSNGMAADVELAGFPHHALDTYLPKLVRAGYKVAVCDQLEDPKMTKKLVKRGVTEVVTPGVSYNPQLLDASVNNFLASLYAPDTDPQSSAGLALIDISTGTVKLAEGNRVYIDSLFGQYRPNELLVARSAEKYWKTVFGTQLCVSSIDDWAFVPAAAIEKVKDHFGVDTLRGYGVETMGPALSAVGAALFYMEQTQHTRYDHLCTLQRIDRSEYMWIDKYSIRNLELFPGRDKAGEGASLIEVIDKTATPMGARLLRQWVVMPLRDKAQIEERQRVVSFFWLNTKHRAGYREILPQIGDLERISSRAAVGRITPREMEQLSTGLKNTALLHRTGGGIGEEQLTDCEDLTRVLDATLAEAPPAQLSKGGVIRAGCNPSLDELRDIVAHSKEYLQQLQQQAARDTGISSLKISYNNVFGYYIEVRNAHKDKVPAGWIRKQTLVNAERYITQELKEYEEKILGAQEKIQSLEQEAFAALVALVQQHIRTIQQNAAVVARIDCLCALATLAAANNYCCPNITEDGCIQITKGRHPVLETLMPPGEKYIPNNVRLDPYDQQIIILTGPNMAGKSALLRQTGLIVLLAQMGSFVPAEAAQISLVDKLFTRVGASDNIARGESTFMVEMLESAAILNNVTDNSLVLFDEIGRGTSTYDGISIAWAIVEYLHQKEGARAKTLFATHYHELNRMCDDYPRVKNFHIAVKESDQKVLFLRKMVPGGVAHSFGIHVAAMAGMPRRVLTTAQDVLKRLEAEKEVPPSAQNPRQLSFFLEDPLLQSLRMDIETIDINKLTPLEAFDALRELKRKIGWKG